LLGAYRDLDSQGYTQRTVNHSLYFVDPDTGKHTNTMETMWHRTKVFLGPYNKAEDYRYHLANYMFAAMCRAHGIPPFINISAYSREHRLVGGAIEFLQRPRHVRLLSWSLLYIRISANRYRATQYSTSLHESSVSLSISFFNNLHQSPSNTILITFSRQSHISLLCATVVCYSVISVTSLFPSSRK
jgi:hypothetical protein